MARFSGRALGHAALLLVAALVAAACGTTQTAQAPTPSPSPSPPGGTVTIAGKVGFGEVFTSEPTAILFPARDGTVVGYWVTSTLPAGASRYERYLQALAGSRIASVAANARAKLQRLAQARARSKVVQPRITYPITAPPAGTATTTGGEYTLNVPASLVGQQITVCVLGPNVTGAPNPGNPSVPGLCGTMTVQANQGGSTFVNRMSFVLAWQQLGTYFVLETQSNIFSTTPLGQATPIQLVTIAPLTAADNAFITNRLIVGMKPATWPNASVYAGNNPVTTAALRVVGSVSGSTYSLRGRVQWRSDSVQNATYQLDARGGDDSVSYGDEEVDDLSCEWTPEDAANNGERAQQIVQSGVVANVDQPFLWLMTTDSVILTPTAQAGYFVLPVAEPLGCVDFLVAQDTSSPAFGEAPATLPESRPTGDRNFSVGTPGGGTGQVVVPFPEPLLSDPSAAASFLNEPEWTLFIPANDQGNFRKANGGTDDNTSPNAVALWDAHIGSFRRSNGEPLHVDLVGRLDAATGARLRFPTTDPELTLPPPTPRQTFRVDWSAQLGDRWGTPNDPINVQDLAGNSTAPGPSLRWLGNVVP